MRTLEAFLPLTRKELGTLGEDCAEEYFAARGFAILERNWRYRKFEIDLIVRCANTLVFVEVKTRRGALGPMGIWLREAQCRNLEKGAEAYLASCPDPEAEVRFDLVCVVPSRRPCLQHTKNFVLPHTDGQ